MRACSALSGKMPPMKQLRKPRLNMIVVSVAVDTESSFARIASFIPVSGIGPPRANSFHRQRMRAFHLAQCEARFDRGDAIKPRELLFEEALIGFEIAHHDAHQIVALAGHEEAVDDFGPAPDRLREAVELFLALALELDRGEDADRQADLGGIDDRGIALDDAVLLEIAHPARAGRGGEPDLLGKLLDGHPAVLLEGLHDFEVDIVQLCHWWDLPNLVSRLVIIGNMPCSAS